MQLAEALREMALSRALAQELQSHVDELQEEVALREKSHTDTSLLSELENSLDALGWSHDKEQVMHCNITQNLSLQSPDNARFYSYFKQNTLQSHGYPVITDSLFLVTQYSTKNHTIF